MAKRKFTEQITFLTTRDIVATHRFYTKTLGLKLVLDQGGCRVYHVTGDAFIGFCERDEAPTAGDPHPYLVYTFVTDDVDGWYEDLKGKGVEFTKPPEANERFRIYHTFFRDPNGYLLEIQRFLHKFP